MLTSDLLLQMLDYSKDLHDHSVRVSALAENFGRAIGLDEEVCLDLKMAGLYHDAGKLTVPLAILNAPRVLSAEEWQIMRSHPTTGRQIAQEAGFNQNILDAVESHHERLDGSGYPNGLQGYEISMMSKIIGICDSVDAIMQDRPYHKGESLESCKKKLLSENNKLDYSLLYSFFKHAQELFH